jgi:hypothetical protein
MTAATVPDVAAFAAGVAEPSTVVVDGAGSDYLPHDLVTTVLPPTWLAGIEHPVSLRVVQCGTVG